MWFCAGVRPSQAPLTPKITPWWELWTNRCLSVPFSDTCSLPQQQDAPCPTLVPFLCYWVLGIPENTFGAVALCFANVFFPWLGDRRAARPVGSFLGLQRAFLFIEKQLVSPLFNYFSL